MSEPRLPSGEQFEIQHGDQVAVLTEVGATLRHYSVAGRHVIDGFEANEVCGAARGQHLIPWPNRLRDGRYEFEGKQQQVALTEPKNGNAIHGLVRWANWRAVTVEPARVVMGLELHPQPGWAGSLDLTVTAELGPEGLTITTRAVNSGPVAVPYGAGSHPYLTLGGDRVDSMTVQVPAGRYLLPDDRGIPVDPRPVDGTAYDFRAGRRIGDLVLDAAFVDVDRETDGRLRVRISDDETGHATTIWADDNYSWLQLFTGDTLPAGKARAGLAVEPMTCGPDAFNTGVGLLVLAPGDTHEGTWGITPAR